MFFFQNADDSRPKVKKTQEGQCPREGTQELMGGGVGELFPGSLTKEGPSQSHIPLPRNVQPESPSLWTALPTPPQGQAEGYD